MLVRLDLKEIWSSTIYVRAKSVEDAEKLFKALSIEKFQNYCDGDLKFEVKGEHITPDKKGSYVEADITKVVGYEASCTECDETFNPHNVDDLVHLTKADGEECGGQGELTGWWS